MTEIDYIKVTNKEKLVIAKNAIREVMIIDGVGLDEGKLNTAYNLVSELLEQQFKEIKINETQKQGE